MVPNVSFCKTINHKIEIHQEASKLFGFANVVNKMSILIWYKPLEFKILIVFYFKTRLCFNEM